MGHLGRGQRPRTMSLRGSSRPHERELQVMEVLLLAGMLPALCLFLLAGVPVAFALIAVAFLLGLVGVATGAMSPVFFTLLPDRLYGIMTNDLLIAIPLFIFMGLMLERSGLAEELLETMGSLFGRVRAGLGLSVIIVGMLLAASTGIVGATVIAMGLMSLPTMIKHGYSKSLACGSICAAGTLGQIIPPSVLLILLTDQVTNAYRVSQSMVGNMSPESISVLDLFAGAIVPGLVLVAAYMLYQIAYALVLPASVPRVPSPDWTHSRRTVVVRVLRSLLPPLLLMIAVLGSILGGIATATEAAGIGAIGAVLLARASRRLNLGTLRTTVVGTMALSAMIFTLLIGATVFAMVFRGLGGDEVVHDFLVNMPGGITTALLLVMLTVFLLGFVLDFIEIMVIVIPVVGPPLFMIDVHPIWFAILLSVNLQTSFLTPPFGFSLFYLQGVAPEGVTMGDIYRGVFPFIGIQLLVLVLIWNIPELATWLPDALAGREMFQ